MRRCHEVDYEIIGDAMQLVVVELDPGDPGVKTDLASTWLFQNRNEDAERGYREVIAKTPGFVQAHVNLGQAHRDLAQVAQAEAHFSRAVSMAGDFVPARHRRALLRHAVGNHSAAITDLDHALALQPGFHDARALPGECGEGCVGHELEDHVPNAAPPRESSPGTTLGSAGESTLGSAGE